MRPAEAPSASDALYPREPLRLARWAEAVYAVVAFFLAFALPWPPRGAGIVLWAHWLGTALLAATIAMRLRRPNQATWYVAAILAAYVLLNAVAAAVRLAASAPDTPGRPGGIALGVGAVLWIAQAIVAICLYRTRGLRHARGGRAA